jgi:hypothetical protein
VKRAGHDQTERARVVGGRDERHQTLRRDLDYLPHRDAIPVTLEGW